MTKSLIDQLVDHALDTPFEAFDAKAITGAKMRLLDALSCGVSGADEHGNDAMLQVLSNMGGAPQASVIGSNRRLPLAHAAMLNSLQIRSFDFEVCGPEPEGVNAGKMVGHVASTTEPTALNVAEFTGASGKELLAAVILGGDIAARISVSNTFNFDADFEVCGTSNAFGATAIAGRLLGLSHDELRNAFGIVLNLMAGSYQGIWDGVASFKLPGAMAAYNGIFACQMAQAGFTGVQDALESRLGFFHLYTKEPRPQNMVADLGEIFYVHGQHKMHPSCYGNHNPIDAALKIREEHSLTGEDVKAVIIDVRPERLDHFLNQVPTRNDAQPKFLFTIPYGVANALQRGTPELEHYTDEGIQDPKVLDLTTRVRLEPNILEDGTHAIRVRVQTHDGQEFESFRDKPSGWLTNPIGYDDVVEKFWRNIRFKETFPQEQGNHVLEIINDLENVENVTVLAESLSTVNQSAVV